jgi:seryl-tRNA synthetase
MIKSKYILENREDVIEAMKNRFVDDAENLINTICALQNKRVAYIREKESYANKQKEASEQVKELFKNGKADEGKAMVQKASELKEKVEHAKTELKATETELETWLLKVPNIPLHDVPVGNNEEDNVIIKEHNVDKRDNSNFLPHWELSDKYDLIDFDRGSKLTGAGFPVYKGKCAKLQRALIQFFLDEAEKAGYEEVQVPHLINKDSGRGTGQLPDKDGQMYHCEKDDLYLIPTAEVPITNLYRDEIVELPIKHVGYTPCFRREAGSYGKDVKGLNRLHQFDKVEIVQVVEPENSMKTLDSMCKHVEKLLNLLDLKWRKVKLCTGDLGFTSAVTYDYEVYSEGQAMWLEVSSVSNFKDFQANRLNLRYRDENGNTKMCYTLNGSALALPRIMAAILESYQDDESIDVPYVLQKYTGFETIE